MARKRKSRKTKSSWAKLLFSRSGISAIIISALTLLGCFYPELQGKIAEVLNVPSANTPLTSKVSGPLTEGIWDVVRVVDGDTLIVGDAIDKKAQYRVRLIGADTPETVKPNSPVEPFGPEASEFTKRKIAEAKNRVRIAFDGDEVDRYGRSLAMVYLQMPGGNEIWLNEQLIREGLARAQVQYKFSQGAKTAFKQAEAEAKAARRNIWR